MARGPCVPTPLQLPNVLKFFHCQAWFSVRIIPLPLKHTLLPLTYHPPDMLESPSRTNTPVRFDPQRMNRVVDLSQSVYTMQDMVQGVSELILSGRFATFWELAEPHLERLHTDLMDERICVNSRTAIRDVIFCIFGALFNGGELAEWIHCCASHHVNCLDHVYLCAECTSLTTFRFLVAHLRHKYYATRALDAGYGVHMGLQCNEYTGFEYAPAPRETARLAQQPFPLRWRPEFVHPAGAEGTSGILRIFNSIFSAFGMSLPPGKTRQVEFVGALDMVDVPPQPLAMLSRDPERRTYQPLREHLERQWQKFQDQLYAEISSRAHGPSELRVRCA